MTALRFSCQLAVHNLSASHLNAVLGERRAATSAVSDIRFPCRRQFPLLADGTQHAQPQDAIGQSARSKIAGAVDIRIEPFVGHDGTGKIAAERPR